MIIYIGLLASVVLMKDQLGPSNQYVNKARGISGESPEKLLSRIEWGNGYTGRISYFPRALFLALFVVVMVKIMTGVENLKLFIIVFAGLIAFNNYFDHHSDKFVNAFCKENVRFIRKRLGFKRVPLEVNKCDYSLPYLNYSHS